MYPAKVYCNPLVHTYTRIEWLYRTRVKSVFENFRARFRAQKARSDSTNARKIHTHYRRSNSPLCSAKKEAERAEFARLYTHTHIHILIEGESYIYFYLLVLVVVAASRAAGRLLLRGSRLPVAATAAAPLFLQGLAVLPTLKAKREGAEFSGGP